MCLQPDYRENRVCAQSAAGEPMALSRRALTNWGLSLQVQWNFNCISVAGFSVSFWIAIRM